jgi:hypothetical protein
MHAMSPPRLKHHDTIKRFLANWHEDWMDDDDKAAFDEEALRVNGAELDAAIEAGVFNGYTAEQQLAIMESIFRVTRR